MSSLNEITFAVLDTVRPNSMTNSSITTELIQFHIKTIRSQLAKQSIEKNRYIPDAYVQSLGCIELIKADKSECCDYPTDCTILRTSVQIPQPLDISISPFIRVGPVDIYQTGFQNIPMERVPFLGDNKYTKNLIKWFTNHSNYIYLVINNSDLMTMGLKVINVQCIIEDPLEASKFSNCATNDSCFSLDSKYPIPDSVLPTLIEMVIKKFTLLQSQQPVDNSNNAKEDPKTTITRG